MAGTKRSISTDTDVTALHKEWDEASCPICMDHPHNAVLLLCSSHDKGCRSYICDTSYRHSNCLDQFKKMRKDLKNGPTEQPVNMYSSTNTSDLSLGLGMRTDLNEAHENHNQSRSINITFSGLPRIHIEMQGEGSSEAQESESLPDTINPEEFDAENSSETGLCLKCPMCRGSIKGWEIIEEARKYFDLKPRSCSRESCSFFGNYEELRRHARRVHPTSRPADVDMGRQRAWRRLEHQREYGDIVSAIRSAIPGAVLLGDYAIENSERHSSETESSVGVVNGSSGPWWTTFFLFQMIGSGEAVAAGPRARSRAWTRHRRALSNRQFLWGSNLLGLQDDDDEDDDDEGDDDNGGLNISTDAEDVSPPRRRRRLTQSVSDEDQP